MSLPVQPFVRTVLLGVAYLAASAPGASAQTDVAARMQSWSRALGVACSHCHVGQQWADGSKPAFAFAGRMSRMVAALNAGAMKDVGGITCWTCHRGRAIPARLPRAAWQKINADHASEFVAQPDRAITMSVYAASLGVACGYCHDADRAANTKPAKAVVATMLSVFDEIPRHFDAARMPTTQCFMCHQGRPQPER